MQRAAHSSGPLLLAAAPETNPGRKDGGAMTQPPPQENDLTCREVEVVRLLTAGCRNQDITGNRVLRGGLRLRPGPRVTLAPQAGRLLCPPNTPVHGAGQGGHHPKGLLASHTSWRPGDGPARYQAVSTPYRAMCWSSVTMGMPSTITCATRTLKELQQRVVPVGADQRQPPVDAEGPLCGPLDNGD